MEIKRVTIRGELFLNPLKELAKPPQFLYLKGRLPNNRQPVVAIVGTRKPTPYGKEVTFKLAYELAKRGVVIVSGLAFGVDSIAHKAALDAGGVTIAVLPSDLSSIYPSSHQGLARQIVENGGAVMSESDLPASPQKHHFLIRNRIVSGLADAIVVTEAGERSGTLSTVNHALDQNKEIFAVPGPITSPLSNGPNNFIKQGAHPVTSVDDILEVIAPGLLNKQPGSETNHPLLKLLNRGLRNTDDLLKESGLTASEFATQLTLLEIDGAIRNDNGIITSQR